MPSMDAAGRVTRRFSGPRLRRIRQRRSLSQRALARAVGVSQTTVHLAETGERVPHERTIGALAEALGVEPQDFFADELDAAT